MKVIRSASSLFLSIAFFCCLSVALVPDGLAQENTAKAGEFTFVATDAWKSVKPTSRMVSAMYEHVATKTPVKIYYFGPGQGGGVEANLQRWRGQFETPPKIAETLEVKEFGGQKVHLLSIDGTFMDGAPFGPKVAKMDSTMLGAILESKQGAVFLKLSGPQAKIADVKADFEALATSPFAADKDDEEAKEEADGEEAGDE